MYGSKNNIKKTTNGGDNWFTINIQGNLILNDLFFNGNNDIVGCGGNTTPNNTSSVNYILRSTDLGSNWLTVHQNKHYTFHDIYFLNQNTGMFVGEGGNLYRTSNSGIDWYKVDLATTKNLFSINFLNSTTGFITGGLGGIYRTINSGNNWVLLNSPTTENVNSFCFTGNDTGYIVCNGNKIFKTSDRGDSWVMQNPPSGPNFSNHQFISASFIDPLIGYVLSNWGYYTGSGQLVKGSSIIKTTNGGQNWEGIYSTNRILNKLYFYNSTGYLLGENSFLKTVDFGNSWSAINNNPYIYYDIKFIDPSTGWAAGKSYAANEYGGIFKTTNGGINWFQQFNQYGKTIRKIHIIDTNNLWCSGEQSSIYKTYDGGGVISSMFTLNSNSPSTFSLSQNYPNPFNPATNIKFDIPASSFVKLRIYDLLGREVAVLVNEDLKPGSYQYQWDGTAFASGIYFYKLEAEDFIETKRMVLVK